ncbi:hypothetical protein, partial [Campylobacter sp.]|uniref:hypothetical protein n=1 Tax=Campylobacter sp. TaxID=205 RepID=UPI003F9F76B2
LSSASFAEGGHISNIYANVGTIDALSLAAGGDNSFGVSGGSAVGAGAGATPVIPPIATITALGSTNVTEGQDWNGPEYKFSLGDLATSGVNRLATRPTTYAFSLSGVEKGVDYKEIETPDGNYVFEYKDADGDWVPMYGNKLTVNDPRDIENLEVRIAQLTNNSIQNQGERVGDDSRFSSIDGAVQGVYERKATVNVTSDNSQIASSSNTGTITDTDDEVSFTKGLDGKTIDTKIGNDIINLYGEIKNGSQVNSGDDDDVVNLYGNLYGTTNTPSLINTGNANDLDIVNIKKGASINKANISGRGSGEINFESGSTADNFQVNYYASSGSTVNIKGHLKSTDTSNLSTINTGNGGDKINITDGGIVDNVQMYLGGGDDKVLINGATLKGGNSRIAMQDGHNEITIKNSTVEDTHLTGYGQHGQDATIFNFDKGSHVVTRNSIMGGGGDDIVNIKSGAIFGSHINLGEGDDVINIEAGSLVVGGSAFYSELHDDRVDTKTLNIKGGEINNFYFNAPDPITNETYSSKEDIINMNITGGVIKSSKFYTSEHSDNVTISGTKISNSIIDTRDGDDFISIGKNANIQDTSKIDGGAGNDTLKIADSSIDFSHVKNIETLDITDVNKTSADTNVVTLSAKDVLDMTDNNNKLRIDGDGNDKLNLSGFNQSSARPVDSDYTEYTSTDGTVTIEIKNDITNITF